MKYILAFLMSASTPIGAIAEEVLPVKFICSTYFTVESVVAETGTGELIHGISPLPSGCEWITPVRNGIIGETIRYIDTPSSQYARVTRVTLDGRAGYSAGIIDLLN